MNYKSPFKNIDPDDIYDVLQKVEVSFNISFSNNDLKEVKNFGELCDIIVNKVQGQNAEDCTAQQAFYKLRNAISSTLHVRGSSILPGTRLEDILPENERRRKISELEAVLGFKTNNLRNRSWLIVTLTVLFIASIGLVFFHWQPGSAGLLLSVAGFIKAGKYQNVLKVQTVGQLAKKIAREHYFEVRRNNETVNRCEIAEKVKELFCYDLKLKEDVIKKDTPVYFD